jgi:hypothetical protein
MSILGLVLAVAGALVAFASKWLTDRLPDAGDAAVNWLKPWALYLVAFGLGMAVGGM